MSEASTTNWADSWVASQKALMGAMFPAAAKDEPQAKVPAGQLQDQFAELQRTWQESIAKWTELALQGPGKAPTAQSLKDLFAPARWSGTGAGVFDAGLRHVLEGPKYATLFDMDRQLLELQQLANQRDKDVAAFQAVVLKAWNSAFERFSAGVAKEGTADVSWRGMADRWLETVNATLIEVHRSDEFVQAQSRMLRSVSDHRLQERRIAEAWCEAMHVPTRTEVDELQRTVTELRRQLRALRREELPEAPVKSSPAKSSPAAVPRKRKPAARRPTTSRT